MSDTDRLLIVDDERYVRKYLADVGRRLNFQVATASNREEFERKLPSFWPSVILLDLQMPGCDGIQMLKMIREMKSDAKIILVSGVDERTLNTASRLGEILGLNMDGVLRKPVLIGAMRSKLNKSRDVRAAVDADDLKKAIENGEIRPVYQPKVTRDAEGNWTMSEAEALARWHRDDSVTILPSEFISVADQYGLLGELTDSLLQQVAKQLRKWRDAGLNMTAAVNMSPSILADSNVPDKLESLMRHYDLDNSNLILELTETEVMQNPELAMEILGRIRLKGFGLSIDDFGTGYSSLEQLYRMPFNELKIDRFLIRDINSRIEAATIVEAMITLGHKLNLSVCAEGVESQHVLTFLLEAGCDKFQGYHIGRPASAEALQKCVREFNNTGFDSLGWNSGEASSELVADIKPNRPMPLLCL
ncbi:MAG: EAL domain-containing response regulator [Woeseiaceae bacterium]